MHIWEWTKTSAYQYDDINKDWSLRGIDDSFVCLTDKTARNDAAKAQSTADEGLAIAQGKSTNYYSDDDPATITEGEGEDQHLKYSIKEGDC